jgi:hypothetical protein
VRLLDGMVENFLNLVAALFKTPTDAAAWRAAHRKAETSIDGKSFVSIGAALFGGASSDNYISSNLVQQLGLGSFVLKGDSCMRVADGREVKVEGKIRMIIRFKDGRGDDVTAELDRLTLSMVIGIRSILDHFMPLFTEMMNGGGDEGTDQEAEEDNRTVPDLKRALYEGWSNSRRRSILCP